MTTNRYWINGQGHELEDEPGDLEAIASIRATIEPWITALLRSEHLSLLIGSGLTNAVLSLIEADPVDMSPASFTAPYADKVDERASNEAKRLGRGEANIEDQVRAALELVGGLSITDPEKAEEWVNEVKSHLTSFGGRVLEAEASILSAMGSEAGGNAVSVLAAFLGAFTSRAATRDRLHVFTTNYDRVIELGLDQGGTWKLDRFLGSVRPVFRASRLDVDIHYSPPGIRGEPRYLEGVVRMTKLHGSVDWVESAGVVSRVPVEFGCPTDRYREIIRDDHSLLVYPNPARDIETSEYPYSELFRDFASATVRPNSVLVSYGYGFGDDHINRVVADMLTVPSTHLLILAYGDPEGRIQKFIDRCGRPTQISYLIGPHLGDLETLVHFYLPKPSIDRITVQQADLLRKRGLLGPVEEDQPTADESVTATGADDQEVSGQ